VTTQKATARKRADARPGSPAAASREAKHLAPEATAERPGAATFEGQYRVEIPKAGFEGPLDLLLHLIQQHELDILDIPVSFVTQRFLAYLKMMQTLTIDVASEYLVMAATLAHIKSKMLLPTVPSDQDDGLPGEEEEDPRAELVRRLLEYQKYKAAAADLAERGTLGKDVFGRGAAEPVPEGPAPFASLGVFSLLDAFEKVLKKANIKVDHEVYFDRLTITDRIVELTEKLTARRAMSFEDLILEPGRQLTRFDIVITFLAILEMAKMRLLRVYQSDPLSPLHVELTVMAEGSPEGGEENAGEGAFTAGGEGEA
jgi:segregation and condensation protein A